MPSQQTNAITANQYHHSKNPAVKPDFYCLSKAATAIKNASAFLPRRAYMRSTFLSEY
jgi:hypothetical protein